MENYTALIADIKNSRTYSVEDRNDIQGYIFNVISVLNYVFSSSLASAVDFSGGDEIQGLFNSSQAAYLYFRLFNMLIFPVEIRAGMGVGKWSVKIENASSAAQDGPAYHRARTALKTAKDAPGYTVLLHSGSRQDLFLNSFINTPFELNCNHSEYQNALMLFSELLYPIDYRKTVKPMERGDTILIAALNVFIDYHMYSKNNKVLPIKPGDLIGLRPIPTDAAEEEAEFYVSSGRVKGITYQLSEILNISRQSLDKSFKAASIFEARNAAIVALKFMGEYL